MNPQLKACRVSLEAENHPRMTTLEAFGGPFLEIGSLSCLCLHPQAGQSLELLDPTCQVNILLFTDACVTFEMVVVSMECQTGALEVFRSRAGCSDASHRSVSSC